MGKLAAQFVPVLIFLAGIALVYTLGKRVVRGYVTVGLVAILLFLANLVKISGSDLDAKFLEGAAQVFPAFAQAELAEWGDAVNTGEHRDPDQGGESLDGLSLPMAIRTAYPGVRPVAFRDQGPGNRGVIVVSWGGPYYRWAVCYALDVTYEPPDALRTKRIGSQFIVYTRR